MANLININAESGANLIGDDAQPTITFQNTSTGAALSLIQAAKAGNATVGIGMTINGQSVASGAVFAFTGDALVSASSILFTTGGVAGTYAIRVVTPKGTFGWIPVLPDGAVTLAAAA